MPLVLPVIKIMQNTKEVKKKTNPLSLRHKLRMRKIPLKVKQNYNCANGNEAKLKKKLL